MSAQSPATHPFSDRTHPHPNPSSIWTRRRFIGQTGTALGLCLSSPSTWWMRGSKPSETRIAVLADSHIMAAEKNMRFAEQLNQAVEQINRLRPQVDAVFFAGNLSHLGEGSAMALGQRILSSLKAPLIAVPGLRDWYSDDGAQWHELFGSEMQDQSIAGVRVISLMSAELSSPSCRAIRASQSLQRMALLDNPDTPRFAVSQARLDWLASALRRDPLTPTIILSPTPLYPYFKPWNFYSKTADSIAELTFKHRHIAFVHGFCQHALEATWNMQNHFGAPSTAWTWPHPLWPDPAVALRRKTFGTGFSLITFGPTSGFVFHPKIWQHPTKRA